MEVHTSFLVSDSLFFSLTDTLSAEQYQNRFDQEVGKRVFFAVVKATDLCNNSIKREVSRE